MTTMNKFSRFKIQMLMYAMGLLLAFTAACTDNYADDSYTPGTDTGEDVMLTFNLRDAASPATGTSGDPSSDAVFKDDLVALIFRKSEQGEQGYHDGEVRYDCWRPVKAKADNGNQFYLRLPVSLSGDELTIMLCANATSVLGSQPDDKLLHRNTGTTGYPYGYTIDETIEALEGSVSEKGWGKDGNKTIPMWAQCNKITFDVDDLKAGNVNLGTFKLLRSLARVDVGVNAKDPNNLGNPDFQGLLNGGNGGQSFKLTKVLLGRTMNRYRLAPSTGNYTIEESKYASSSENPYTIHAPSLPTDASGRIDWVEAVVNETSQSVESLLYAPEQKAGASMKPEQWMEYPCVIVGGIYDYANTSAVRDTSYYRLDFVKGTGNSQTTCDILRSSLYRFNITAVKGPGFRTPEEALNSRGVNMTVELSAYNLVNSNTTFDGQSFISLERMELTMPREQGVSYNLPVEFSGDIAWSDIEISAVEDQGYIKDENKSVNLGSDALSVTKLTKIEGERNTHYLKVSTLQAWSQDVDTKLYLRAKRLQLNVELRQRDVSLSDWELGSKENGSVDGEVQVSATSFTFSAPGGEQKLTLLNPDLTVSVVMKQGTSNVEWVDETGKPLQGQEPDWMSLTNPDGTAITLQAKTNPTGSPRKLFFKIKVISKSPVESMTSKEHIINVSQFAFSTQDLILSEYNLTWRDRNVGASNNSVENFEGQDFTKDNVSHISCPTGWFIPASKDVEELLKLLDTKIIQYYSLSDGDSNGKATLMLYKQGLLNEVSTPQIPIVRISDMNNVSSSIWLIDRDEVGNETKKILTLTLNNGKVLPSINSNPSSLDKAHIRCVQGFRVNKNFISLNALGEPVNTGYLSRLKSDVLDKIDDNSNGILTVNVSPSLKSMKIEAIPNWSQTPREYKLVYRVRGESNRVQEITVKQDGRAAVASWTNPTRVGNLEWAPMNYGISQNVNPKYVGLGANRSGQNLVMLTMNDNGFSSWEYISKTDERKYIGDYINAGDDNAVLKTGNNIQAAEELCAGMDGGGKGWRLPTLQEFAELIRHIRVEKRTTGTDDGSQTHYLYSFTDGKTVTFLSASAYPSKDLSAGGMTVGYYTSNPDGNFPSTVKLQYQQLDGDILFGSGTDLFSSFDKQTLVTIAYAGTSNKNYLGFIRCVRTAKVVIK